MAWLGTWAKRIEITPDYTNKIGGSVTWFPIDIIIESGLAGVGDKDVSCIFDELTTNDNRLKIAVTEKDGTTELYVEIEQWDDVNENAVLHCSLDGWTIDNDDDHLFIYYDSAQDDNVAMVSDSPNTNVWRGEWELVNNLAVWNWEAYKEANGIITSIAPENYHLLEPSVIYRSGKAHPYQMWVSSGWGDPNPAATFHFDSDNGVDFTRRGVAGVFQRAQIIYNSDAWTSPLKGAVADDGGVQTDETTEANEDTANDMTLLPATRALVNDAYYIGGPSTFNYATVNIGTPGVKGSNNWALTWEHYYYSMLMGTASTGDPGDNTKDYIIQTAWLADESGTVNYIKVYSGNTCNSKVGIYSNDGGEPKTLLGSSNSTAIAAGWNYVPLTSGVSVTKNTYYWIVQNSDDSHLKRLTGPGEEHRRYVAFAYANAFPADYTNPFDYRVTDSHDTGADCVAAFVTNDNGTWAALSGVVDGTSDFTAAAGNHDVKFDLPSYWGEVAVDGITAYWIRARVSSADAADMDTQPKGTQAWVVCDYWAYGHAKVPADTFALYTSADETHFSIDTASCLTLGVAGKFDDGGLGAMAVWKEGGTFYATYCGNDGNWPNDSWEQGNAHSADGRTWIKDYGAGDGSSIVTGFSGGADETTVCARQITKIGSTYYELIIGKPDNVPTGSSGTLPSEIWLISSTDKNTWTVVGGVYNPIITRTKTWEGASEIEGQVADPWWIEQGGYTYIYYSGLEDGSQVADVTRPTRIGLVKIPYTIAEIISHCTSINDSTSNTNDPDGQGTPIPAVGKVGNARDFDGSTSFIDFADGAVNPNLEDFMFSFWTQIKGGDGVWREIIRFQGDGGEYTLVGVDAANKFIGSVRDAGSDIATAVSSDAHAADGTWYFVTATWDASTHTLKVYENAVEKGADTDATVGALDTDDLQTVGSYTDHTTAFYAGIIDDMKFWVGTLPGTAWITGLYNSSNDSLLTYGDEEGAGGGSGSLAPAALLLLG